MSNSHNIRNNGPVLLLLQTRLRHCNYFLSSVATDGNDGHGFKLQKILHPFIYVFILLHGKMPTCENYKPFAGSSINK